MVFRRAKIKAKMDLLLFAGYRPRQDTLKRESPIPLRPFLSAILFILWPKEITGRKNGKDTIHLIRILFYSILNGAYLIGEEQRNMSGSGREWNGIKMADLNENE